MATRMMLRTSKNNGPILQVLSVMKDKTVHKSIIPTVAEASVFCGGFWANEGKDDFRREMMEKGLWGGGGLDVFNEKCIGVKVYGRRKVKDEDEDEDEDDVDSEKEMDDFDDYDGGVDDDDYGFGGHGDEDGDCKGHFNEEETKYVRKNMK